LIAAISVDFILPDISLLLLTGCTATAAAEDAPSAHQQTAG